MKRLVTALAVFIMAAATSGWAAEYGNDHKPMEATAPMGMKMMPQHLLIMGYHKNLLTFGHALDKVAHQGETVAPYFARIAVAEMRRSVDQLEKYRAEVLHNMPAEAKGHEGMQKEMNEHLVNVKMHLRELEILVANDRIPSQEVIKHLEAIFEGCSAMGCEFGHGKGKYGHDGYDRHGCGCRHDMTEAGKMHGRMMAEMLQRMKAYDAEMAKAVAGMNTAPGDNTRKENLMADIVTRMVQQHAAMTGYMEKMMQTHMRYSGCDRDRDDDGEDGDND